MASGTRSALFAGFLKPISRAFLPRVHDAARSREVTLTADNEWILYYKGDRLGHRGFPIESCSDSPMYNSNDKFEDNITLASPRPSSGLDLNSPVLVTSAKPLYCPENHVIIKVDRFGFSANNVTYQALGEHPHFRCAFLVVLWLTQYPIDPSYQIF